LEIGARLADAYTLLTDFGSVQNHAPGVETIGESVFRQLMSGVTTLAQENQPRSEVAGWQIRLKAAFGRQQPAEASALHSAVSDHAIRQQAIEGLALSKLESSDPESALRVLAEAPEPLQAGPWSALIAGIAHLQLQRPAIARKAFGSIDKGTPLWPLAAFLTGKCWRQEGRPDEAINSWNSAVLAWPEESRWQSELALVYRQQGKPEAALPHLQTALEMAPDQHDLRLPLARTLFELGDLSGAINQYLQVLPQFEQDAEVITEIGQSLLAAGQFERAYDLFLQALEVKHDHLAAEVGAAQAAWHQGEVRLAEKHSAKAIRRNPRQPDLVRSLAEIKLQAGEANQVLALIEEAYGQTDLPTDIARIKASALFERGQAQDSINLLKKIVEQDPEDDQSWAALSQAYAGANQPGQAIDALRLALNLRPGYKPYRLELARLFRRTGQLDQALEELSSLQNEEPRDHDVPLEIGLVHQSRRQLQKALTAFQRSISLNESGAAAYFQAGMVLKSLKAYPQSVEMLEKAVSINPSDSEAMHQLAAVQALQLVHGGMQTTAVSQ
jgi:tetratricopeptide (TPR) repeat protein